MKSRYSSIEMTPDLRADLWHKIEAKLDRTDPDHCWMWGGRAHGGGKRYGGVTVAGQSRYAHRVAYEVLIGPIPDGLELDHLCRNRWCCNPTHLEPVTHAENMRRGSRAQEMRDRGYRCKVHTDRLMVRTTAGRICRLCRREANVRYRRRLGGTTLAEGLRRVWAKRSPERRAEISRKIWETRRRNAAA